MEFSGKTVIVTGSTRGIGKAIAEKFAELGANVMLSGTTDKVYDVVNELKGRGFSVAGFAGDLAVPENAQAIVDQTVETFGGLDILVNNAGITRDKLLIKMEEEDWDTVMDINLKSVFLLTKAAVKIMMKKKKGTIINLSSVVGLMGNSSQANYAASKAGLIGFTKSVAKEYARRGITCNAIAPGFIETEMTGSLPEEVKEYYLKNIPLGRPGTTSEVADLAVFLASDRAQYITGQVINIDGGLYM
ncbi:MAG TPA: 3-oxoacyl-[acyl-carrier-protein] reductase [Thermoclostridium caenicola]|uniref:3-oxoacyl-[acyl-carrier-protein] reductase n=1 Tax=Thermoclostridium caenicola TaxID=659425 RepID=A0A1M6FTT5_9FIRM|nr:3-oxoacyl-[acyl-carrier-protein] reductase [Thermoclostridium caenicola]SHJ01112.1 3-oxoacyl-[acyl-carrier-protein] reductase [Thermoclostridium caenicola]HOK42269.1 3-oxoacyl-[acyl-carrier-protein] reductase [Thermoclostridium caenicola]HOL85571.1 3-oxoacyl-[acyl-carrier-protein] reductase [Thermoclostridium caenicola]HOP72912.1 3-oxoacyl-[acyl-carrier-protein] reductase [Thermoclostridium caenicola]HPO76748.1 3-oxoacyl-[acyl-carrier-protein] reductase [Thermoclostridium caenicola]